MRLSEPQLASLLRRNPELSLVGDAGQVWENSSERNPMDYSAIASDSLQFVNSALSEEQMQMALIRYCLQRGQQDPTWLEIFHVPSGGHRHKAVAGKLKALGVRRGLLDLYWLVPARRYHGFALELKRPRGRLTPEQRLEIARLFAHGYWAGVAWTLEDATARMEWYYAIV